MLLTSGNDYAMKIIVLVSDGKPECVYDSVDQAAEDNCTDNRELNAYDSADYAEENGSSIFAVSFNDTYDPVQSAVMEAMVRGYGRFYETPYSSDLETILDEIANQIPISLVN